MLKKKKDWAISSQASEETTAKVQRLLNSSTASNIDELFKGGVIIGNYEESKLYKAAMQIQGARQRRTNSINHSVT